MDWATAMVIPRFRRLGFYSGPCSCWCQSVQEKNRGVGGEKRIECVSILAKLGQVNFANEMVAAPHPHPHTKSKPIAFAVRIPATFSWLKCQLRLRENKEKNTKTN